MATSPSRPSSARSIGVTSRLHTGSSSRGTFSSFTHAISRLVDAAQLELIHDQELASSDAEQEFAVVEAVITANSTMIGNTIDQLGLRERYGLSLLALSRSGHRIAQRLRRVRFQDGDLLVLRGRAERINDKLAALGCLPLAERNVPLGRTRNLYLPAVILCVAMVLVTTGVVSVPVGFFGAAVAMLTFQLLTLREAYEAVEWPILILFGALIPVSEALQATGATDLVAGWLSTAAQHLPPLGALGMMLIAAMALTPFLNNAATVLVMAPIGASLAGQLGLSPDPFLMAVAVGAGCDFLTPVGHQCNTLVMGPGGYRFGDYWRLGLPLSLIVAILGTFLISWFWPLR
jgi:di/tricarboxylate transporter